MALASVFAVLAALLMVVGVVYEPFVVIVALLFGAVAYFMWYQASGKLARRLYRRVEQQGRANNGRNERGGFGAGPREEWEPQSEWARRAGFTAEQRRQRGGQRQRQRQRRRFSSPRSDRSTPTTSEAYDILDLEPSADEPTIKRAYRNRVKDAHPDTESGSEEEFKRVNAAYEQLTEG